MTRTTNEALCRESFLKLREYIYEKSGIFLEEEKHLEKMEKKLIQRMYSLKIEGFKKYFHLLRHEDEGGREFQELINALTVNETYFFRESYQFDAMIKYLLPAIDALKKKDETIRILSAPCSSGEEAYSIAIRLTEDNDIVRKRDIEIVGIDINSIVIEKAKKGRFSERSVHLLPQEIKEKYFRGDSGHHEIDEALKDAIEFKTANIFDKEKMYSLGKFDIIFSRNMLIYFDDESRKNAVMTFYDMLHSGGYILLGHAEYMSRITPIFNPRKFEGVLAYQK